jgi:tetratricopeptide (TPR) repeat protein
MIDQFIHETRFRLMSLLDERRPLDGLLGLPAFFALILLGFMGLNSRDASDREHWDKLEREAQSHLDKGHFAEARIAAVRLTQDQTQNQKALLIEAKAFRGMGRERDALRLLSRIAPLDRPGYAPAHVLEAVILLGQKTPDVQTAQRHMDNALLSDPSNQDALELAARFAAGRRNWKAVLQHLAKLELEQRADLLLMKATALQFSGQEEQAVKVAARAETALRELQKATPTGADQIRFSIAASLSLQRQFEQAVQWMLGTLQGSPTQQERQVIGGIYLSWSRYLKAQPASDKAQVIELLEKGIQISPESQDLIMAFLGDCDELPIGGQERLQHVGKVLNKGGIATSFLHYYQGVQEWKQGRKDAARVHFELASSLNPGFGVISNNLAMAIASVSDDRSDLERALAMMNGLLRQDPENPFFLDTRGHVLAKLGQLNEAVRDLERSLSKTRNKEAAHLMLVELYHHLGMHEQAAQHQSMLLAEQAAPKAATR